VEWTFCAPFAGTNRIRFSGCVLSLDDEAPRYVEASITHVSPARYDGVAEWYDRAFATGELAVAPRETALRLLGEGPGRLVDVGCGTGAHTTAFADRGWETVGVDISEDQLKLARERGLEVVQADAAALPFDDASFDAAVSMWTHTDVEDFSSLLREVVRVLRPRTPFVYVGAHPCFVGPHSRFVEAEGMPVLHPGYWETGRYTEAPGISPTGLRAKVGAVHLPLGLFIQSFLDAKLRLEHFEELERREYPYTVALRCRR
jgi:SAM-dependent methyltransferase